VLTKKLRLKRRDDRVTATYDVDAHRSDMTGHFLGNKPQKASKQREQRIQRMAPALTIDH